MVGSPSPHQNVTEGMCSTNSGKIENGRKEMGARCRKERKRNSSRLELQFFSYWELEGNDSFQLVSQKNSEKGTTCNNWVDGGGLPGFHRGVWVGWGGVIPTQRLAMLVDLGLRFYMNSMGLGLGWGGVG